MMNGFSNTFSRKPQYAWCSTIGGISTNVDSSYNYFTRNKGMVTHAISHEVNFKKEVIPGRKYEIKTKVESWKRGICIGYGNGYTDGELACEAKMTITIPEILKKFLPKK